MSLLVGIHRKRLYGEIPEPGYISTLKDFVGLAKLICDAAKSLT
jgi:hypothetical protein